MATHIHNLWYCGNLIYDISKYPNHKPIEKVNPREHKCRVWVMGSKHYLGNDYCAKEGNYADCLKEYKRLCKEHYCELQVFHKDRNFGTYSYIDNKDEYYSWLYNERSKEMERNDPSRFWRAGDAPWDAPGMSIHDFF